MTYRCHNCQSAYPQFQLVCTDCGEWNSLKQELHDSILSGDKPVALANVREAVVSRIKTNIRQIDALLDGGFVPGSSVLLSGPPGAGKSTLVMQILYSMSAPALYVTGEESVQQLKLRADRLNIRSRHLYLLSETNVNRIVSHVHTMGSHVVVIDSVQTMFAETSDALPGSPAQIRRCCYLLRRLAQEKELCLMLVGQVTKNNTAAGPKYLEHAVDVVLSIDAGEKNGRTLMATKNRYGSTACVCTMKMDKAGLVFHTSNR